jgi:plasmid stabilization system protein ParE
MKIELHPHAANDLADAADFYRQRAGSVIAQRFLDEFERIARFALRHPELGTPVQHGRRRLVFQVFPYSLIYRQIQGGIRVVVIRHHHRKPGFGASRH